MNFTYFLTPPDAMPAGVGFQTFGLLHLIWLAAISIFCYKFCKKYRQKPRRLKRSIYKKIALCLAGLEVIKICLYGAIGALSWKIMPLHLCGISIFIVLADAFKPTALKHQLVCNVVLIGGVIALLFPDWTHLPAYHFANIISFLFHGIMVLYVAFNLSNNRIRPDIQWLPKSFAFLGCLALPIYFLNKRLNTNFFFLNGAAPGTPLVQLEGMFGNPQYILCLIALLWIVWIILHHAWRSFDRKRNSKRTIMVFDKE